MRWIVPILLLLITILYNPRLGSLLIFFYAVYLLWSNRAGFLSWLAVKKYRQSDMEGALKWFSRAAGSRRVGGTVLLSYSLVLLKTGHFDSAEEALERAAEQELSDYDKNALSAMRGLLEWKRGNAGTAMVSLRSLAEDFENITLYGALGSLYLSQGRADEALRISREGLELDKYDRIINDNLGRAHYVKGDVEQAEEIFDELVDREVRIPEPYVNKALILEDRGELDQASGLVDRAKKQPYSHLSYFAQDEINGIIDRIESKAESEDVPDFQEPDDDETEAPGANDEADDSAAAADDDRREDTAADDEDGRPDDTADRENT
jgi:tetratricopeptide (TPR) repeat protein